tara:strand:+ start:3716 stop:4654 length:939 start_codon:yes stop_codon:yes gene_type:complete
MMAKKRRQKSATYGNVKNERVADPTRAEINQRCREVHQRRLAAEEAAHEAARQLQGAILGMLHESGGLPAKTIENLLGATTAHVLKSLKELELAGLASRQGGGNQVVWHAVTVDDDHDDPEVGMVATQPILKAFRKKGEAFKPKPKQASGPLANVVRRITGGTSATSSAGQAKTPKAVPVNLPEQKSAKPMAEQTKTSPQRSVDFQTLQNCDSLFESCKALAETTPLDAAPMAKALLRSLLRLAWAKASGKPNTNPLSESIALKLYNRGHLSKNAMRRFNAAIGTDAKLCDVLGCSKALLIWIAADNQKFID